MHGSTGQRSANLGSVPNRRTYSVPEIAQLLGCSERHIWNLVGRRDLGSVKSGRRRVVPEEDLDAYIAKLREEAASVGAA